MYWLKSWLTFGALVLFAWAGMRFLGPDDSVGRAFLLVLLVIAAANFVLSHHVREAHLVHDTHTELLITYQGRALLENRGYGPLGKLALSELDRLDASENGDDDALLPPDGWRFMFLGPPGTGDTVVWSSTHKNMFSDNNLVFDRLWQGVLRGTPQADSEPHLVFDLAEDAKHGHRVYRMYLRPAKYDEKPEVLCYFPVRLLDSNPTPKQRESWAKLFGLRRVPNESVDHFQDRFGEYHLVYPEGEGYDVYETDVFRFKVKHYWGGR